MKKFKRLSAMVAAVLMVGCMMTSFNAFNVSAEGTYSITINGFGDVNSEDSNANDDGVHTYEAYQVFGGTLTKDSETGKYILTNATWGTGINSDGILSAIANDTTNFNDSGITTSSTAQDVINVLSKLSDDSDGAKAFANIVASNLGNASPVESNGGIISGLSNGYYFVQDKDGSPTSPESGNYDNQGAKTRYILRIVGEDIEVNAKSSAPSVMKKVYENQTNNLTGVDNNVTFNGKTYDVGTGYNDIADYNIGDNVPFRLYGSMPSTLGDYDHYYYEFQDTLSKQFTLVDTNDDNIIDSSDFTVKIGTETIDHSKYTVTTNDNGFTLVFNDILSLNSDTNTVVKADSIVTVDYSATLNSNAVIGLNGQENEVKLVYSNNPNNTGDGNTKPNDTGETPPDKVIVFTYELDITKVDGALYETWKNNTDENKGDLSPKAYLKDAEFVLRTSTETTNETNLVDIYRKATTTGEGENAVTTYEYIVGYDIDGTTGTDWEKVTKDTPLKTNADGRIKIKGFR